MSELLTGGEWVSAIYSHYGPALEMSVAAEMRLLGTYDNPFDSATIAASIGRRGCVPGITEASVSKVIMDLVEARFLEDEFSIELDSDSREHSYTYRIPAWMYE
jgi:hypothetical protein